MDGFEGCVMPPGEMIYNAHEYAKGLYFILEGSIVYTFAKHVCMTMNENAVVGVGAIFSPSLVAAQSIAMCDTYILRRDCLMKLAQEFPALKPRIRAQNRVTIIYAITTVSKAKQYFRQWTD